MIHEFERIIQSFAADSTIHSINFIADQKRKKSIRTFWSIALVLSVSFFGLYAYEAYIKWRLEPNFLTRINQRHLNEIPFPALTICSPLFARDNLANSNEFYVKNYLTKTFAKNMTSREANYLMSNLQITGEPYVTENATKLVPNRTNTNIVELLNESTLHTNEILFGCNYGKNHIECDGMFNRVLTDLGFCYSFNMEGFNTIFNNSTISKDFHSYKRTNIRKSPSIDNHLHSQTFNDDETNTKWTFEGGFKKGHGLDEVPTVAQKSVLSRVVMFLNESDDKNRQYLTHENFYYQLHVPNEIFSPFKELDFVYFYDFKDTLLTAKMYRACESLRTYSPDIRGCYFDGERSLKFFKTYTKDHCELECAANYTLEKCKCVKFSMPRDDETPVCNENQTKCYFDVIMDFPQYDSTTKKLKSCNCLRRCIDIKYEVAVNKITKLDSKKLATHAKNASEGDVYSILNVRFNSHLIQEEEMYASYTLQNFVADTGGLLGLFMGCSLLSIVEIIFFCWQIITQLVKHFWKKFLNRNKVQNFISVRPAAVNDNRSQYSDEYLRQLEQNIENRFNAHEQKIENRFNILEQRFGDLERKLQQLIETHERQLRNANENYSIIANFVEKQILSERF